MIENNSNARFGRMAFYLLFVFYWLIAWYIERIDFAARPPFIPYIDYDLSFLTNAVPGQLSFFVELFSFRVLRHLIPFVIGWRLARRAALELIQALYDLPSPQVAESFLLRSQSPDAPPGAPVLIRRTEFKKDRLNMPLLRYGGPGLVRVEQGDVIWTERNARFQRVLGPGVHVLDKYENVRGTLDVRPQERLESNVSLTTQDGIELHADLAITFHIRRDGDRPSERVPFPYVDHAVQTAGYEETLLIDGHVDSWERLPMQITVRKLREIVGKRTLDRLLYPSNPELKPHEVIKERMDFTSRQELKKLGIDLVSTRLGRLEVPDEVTQQRIEYWQTYWSQHQRVRDVSEEANALLQLETARAQAKANAIRNIIEGIQTGQQMAPNASTRDVVAMRMVDALERLAKQSSSDQLSGDNLTSRINSLRAQIEDGSQT